MFSGMKFHVHGFLFLLSFICLSGCAQLSPQMVTFEPSIPTDQLIQGDSTTALEVLDNRESRIIGYRGGVYEETSTIQSSLPLDETVHSLALQVLERAGIEVTGMLPQMSMTISIDELSYISENLRANTQRTTATAAVSIRVQKDNVIFENGYRTSQYIDTFGYPSDERNDELLNQVFDSVLERMFSDDGLEEFIGS